MRCRRSGRTRSGCPTAGAALPLVGWSTTGGDLRIGHFIGLHALQGLPLLAFALLALAPRVPVLRDVAVRARLVGIAGGFWAGLTLLLVWQALRGQSIIAPDGLTLAVGAALVVVTALATAAVLRPRTTPTTVLETQR